MVFAPHERSTGHEPVIVKEAAGFACCHVITVATDSKDALPHEFGHSLLLFDAMLFAYRSHASVVWGRTTQALQALGHSPTPFR